MTDLLILIKNTIFNFYFGKKLPSNVKIISKIISILEKTENNNNYLLEKKNKNIFLSENEFLSEKENEFFKKLYSDKYKINYGKSCESLSSLIQINSNSSIIFPSDILKIIIYNEDYDNFISIILNDNYEYLKYINFLLNNPKNNSIYLNFNNIIFSKIIIKYYNNFTDDKYLINYLYEDKEFF
jgi:hypothetical protein